MGTDPLTPEVRTRICQHMNNDHPEALIEFAKFFGKKVNPKKAKMIDLTSRAITLEVDEENISLAFDHELSDSGDAHRSLVEMLRHSKAMQ